MDRRNFLADLSRYAVLCAGGPHVWRVASRPRLTASPFMLGVASGDPTPDACVIWTRLATDPLAPDGGMERARIGLGWEVAHDEAFAQVVRRGTYTTAPELAHSVHVDVRGLEPDRWYFYRFTLRDGASPVGRLRTAPAAGAPTPLDFAFASCQHWEQGFYTAFEHMARERLDLVVFLGDYIYEGVSSTPPVRTHHLREVLTLDDYRSRYAQYKSDPALQAAHALCPWIVTWDDHEVDNNYAGLAGENVFESEEQMRLRRAAGYQAWWEHQPVRVPHARSWADLDIHRSLEWGGLASFWIPDTRQYRSDQACGDGTRQVPCGDWADPSRTMLGDAQERWLLDGMAGSGARWQVLAQQVMLAPFDGDPGPDAFVSMDPWSGYPVARDRLLAGIRERAPGRTIVVTGDIHSNWVNDLRAGFDRPDRPVVATEFVGTSVTSGGDGEDQQARVTAALAANPHVRWQNSRRGYVRCRVEPGEWRTDYRTVEFVSRPGAPLLTPSSWRCVHGRAGVERVG
jgi:alkaline phosphatase D